MPSFNHPFLPLNLDTTYNITAVHYTSTTVESFIAFTLLSYFQIGRSSSFVRFDTAPNTLLEQFDLAFTYPFLIDIGIMLKPNWLIELVIT